MVHGIYDIFVSFYISVPTKEFMTILLNILSSPCNTYCCMLTWHTSELPFPATASSAMKIDNIFEGVMEVEIKNASTDKKAFLSATGDVLDIAKADDEEIILLQAEIYEMTTKLESVTKKLDQLKHIEGIPSFGTKLSLYVLDDCDEVAEEDSSVESEEVEEDSSVESEEDQESDATFTISAKQDKAIEAVKKKRAELDKEKEALNKKLAQLDKEKKALKKKGARLSLDVLDYSNEVAEENYKESDDTFTTLSEQDQAIEAVKKKRAQLDTEIKKKRAQLDKEIKKKGAQLDKEIEPLNKIGARLDEEIRALEEKCERIISSIVRK
ncbi:uncharacterized protein LOC132273934 isoform X1 [Cornus florida]|uniref:uncharacterized protein LOC132273934 isoform X1 n=1 Tax=Cornus florida TaxID=4283 RepID=UPI002896F5C5|nr:uncharacterized protein LOC132273934 isoform X1 [Cornus florida]